MFTQKPCLMSIFQIGSPREARQGLQDARPHKEDLRSGPGSVSMAASHPGDEDQQPEEALRSVFHLLLESQTHHLINLIFRW